MAIPAQLNLLIERFRDNLPDYKSGKYNETQVRREFIDPLFKLLGWDIDNDKGYAEAYKEVVHEDALKVGQATKAPDYGFRVGGQRKFFLEAKKPSVNIKEDTHPAYQLRRYAWSAKLPLSILTDFEEFAVYDCRVQPDKGDKAAAARIMYLQYEQYPAHWDELVATFSPEAIQKGAFDRYVESTKAKKGTTEVDSVFLQEIERWRDSLARNLARRNSLSQRQLNFAVQRIIDRVIFLRIAEDRGLEPYGQLRDLAKAAEIYPRLMEVFRRADDRYNSGLFHFQPEKGRDEEPDRLTPGLVVDDKIFKEILRHIYYPDSPYEFSVLSADILGQVYEQFLGKVIRLTPGGHRAEVEDKPEVKKAGGVYYTPTYIVAYIVRQTVGKLVEGKKPQEAEGLKIADPACGSGSFLLGAYQFLLDWYRDRYIEDGPTKWAKGRQPRLYQTETGGWKLSMAERKRILLDHIYGVDIDPQAVEVTKLSLLLRVLEDEKALSPQLELIQERVLPDLGNNIKCGNSLIGPDFYSGGQQLALFDEEELHRVNAFDWQAEFPRIMRDGGFDAVIGNPPYGALLSTTENTYLRNKFKDTSQSYDTYELFLVEASRLLKEKGRLSMIIPASWLTGEKYKVSRRVLLTTLTPTVAYAMPFDVFKSAYIDTAIVVFTHSGEIEDCLVHYFPKREKLIAIPDGVGTNIPLPNIRGDELNRFSVILSNKVAPILNKLKAASLTFGNWFDIQRGVQPYSRKKHSEKQISERFLHATSQLNDEYLPELQGSELSRYWVAPERTSFLRYCDEIASTRSLRMFQGKRIVLRRLLTRKFRLQSSMVSETMITTDNVLNLVPCSPETEVTYSLGILNSKIVSWFYVNTSMIAQKDDFPQVHISALAALTIPEADKARHDQMVGLVEQMLSLHQRLAGESVPQTRTVLQRQIEATDRQIDRLVYELYGLTDEEIQIVEGK